jgi:Flp pilus assembly protein TadG
MSRHDRRRKWLRGSEIMSGRLAERFPLLRLAAARFVRRFARNRRGTVAVEFSMIGVPFLGLMTAILQTGIVSLQSVQLSNATWKAARAVKTAQAINGMTYGTFATTYICNNLTTSMFTCANVQMQLTMLAAGNAANWSTLTTTATNSGFYSSTYNGTGGLAQTQIAMPSPAQGSIGVLQVIYPLNPVIAIMSGSTLAGGGGITNISGATAVVNNKHVYLLYAAAAFTVE